MLAGTPRGLTEHFLLARGFSTEMLSSLMLPTSQLSRPSPQWSTGATPVVERIHITDAGRISLEGRPPSLR
jgi:hypothetical protein